MKKFLLILIVFPVFVYTKGQSFYDMKTVQDIEIFFTAPNWDYMMDTAKAGAEGYTFCDSVRVNGVSFDSVGVKYKGNSSYSANKIKNPLHIELDHYKDVHDYQGYTDIKLGNGFKDPTFIREVLTYFIARHYMAAPQSNHARVFINGNYIGLYSNTESVTKKFANTHFYSKSNAFFKCNPVYNTGSKSNLAYLGSDSSLYFNCYEMKSAYGWNDMVMLCDIIKNNPNNINSILDIDRALWMLAIDNLTVNLDSYLGGICQNYYLYRSDNGSFNTILWDMNEAFGCFNNTGEGPPLNLTAMQQMSLWLHVNNSTWPLIQKLLNVPLFRRMYVAHMRTVYNEFFANDTYMLYADTLRTLIDTDVQADVNKMYTYQQFVNGMTSNITSGMLVPGVKVLMDGRKTYLSGIPEFNYEQPTVAQLQVSDTMPQSGDSIFITASVQNANAVFLGFRYAKEDRFIRALMFDDGQHNDGASGDGVFGIKIAFEGSLMHYYIYAENADAGRFLPERAEYNYFTLSNTTGTVSAGQLVINEILAINNSINTDGTGQFSDWVELFNTTSDTLILNNICVSDNYSVPCKWKIPSGTTLPPHSYILLWANDDTLNSGLNMPFKLSGSGEYVILSYENGIVIDSTVFPVQSGDISYGRWPNGTGSFTAMPPTPAQVNMLTGLSKYNTDHTFIVYPNPAATNLHIRGDRLINDISLMNNMGQNVYKIGKIGQQEFKIQLNGIPSGLYFLMINHTHSEKIIIQKR